MIENNELNSEKVYQLGCKLNGAVPQGSWLGPLCFIVDMNDMELQDGTLTHKYIDDITISESTSCSNVSLLQTAVDKVKDWSDKNSMKLIENKTKKCISHLNRTQLQSHH